jgi:hypothetical protein
MLSQVNTGTGPNAFKTPYTKLCSEKNKPQQQHQVEKEREKKKLPNQNESPWLKRWHF